METQYKWHRLIARLLIAATTSLQLPQETHAAMIRTDASVLLETPDLPARLEACGVRRAGAMAHVAAMTDIEAAQLGAGIEDAPADGVVKGVTVLVGAGTRG